jgi:PAS domain S-box-containing protein
VVGGAPIRVVTYLARKLRGASLANMAPGAPTIVIVDDAADLRALVRMQLRRSGRLNVVAEGEDGAEAVALAAEHQPDLLLLDISMPVMDGLEALPKVRQVAPATRVVMLTGFDERGLADRARELGAVALLEKSVALQGLAEQLLGLLSSSGVPVPAAVAGAHPASDESPDEIIEAHLERFREVFEEAAIGMATMTLTGRIVRSNKAMADLVHRSVPALVGTAITDLMTAAAAPALRSALADVTTGGRDAVALEVELGHFDTARRALVTLAPVRDTARRPLYLFVQVQDVTSQRAAEEALRQSEERFRLVVDSVSDYAIFMLDQTGHVMSWNVGAQRIKGYRAEDIIGRHFRTFYPEDKQAIRHPENELELALRDGSYSEEGWRIRKDGSRFWANVVITAVRDPAGTHLGFVKVTRDITAQRFAEDALRQSEERFRLLVAAVGDYAIFMLDPDGYVVSWNVGAQRLKGYTAEEIIGQHFRTFYPEDKQAIGHPEHELQVALREGSYEEEGWRIRKDGSRFWANVVITPVRDASGTHVGFAKVTRDVTERRRMLDETEAAAQALAASNADLALANTRLAEAAADQAQFLAVTAHELRTPIGILGGSTDLLQHHWRELEEPEREELLESMASNTARLRRLLDDLLTAARLEARAVEMNFEAVSLSALLTKTVATLRTAHRDGDVVLDVGEDMTIVADAGRVAQAVDNLINNALAHGQPPVHVTAHAAASGVQIRVSDSGPGVPEDIQPRLFGRFATGARRGGTGLGLFIVRQLARAHHGDSWYEPRRDGADPVFVIYLPWDASAQ